MNANQFSGRWMDGRHQEGRCEPRKKGAPRPPWGEPPSRRLQGECPPAHNREAPFPMGPRYYASRFDLFHMPSALSRGGGEMGLLSVCFLCRLSSARPQQKKLCERSIKAKVGIYIYIHGKFKFFLWLASTMEKKKSTKNPSKQKGSKLKWPKMHVQYFKG